MKRFLTVVIIPLCFLCCNITAGAVRRAVPDTLILSKTLSFEGYDLETLFQKAWVWRPEGIKMDKEYSVSDKMPDVVGFNAKDGGFKHRKAKSRHKDFLFFKFYIKCEDGTCSLYMTDIDVLCNHGMGEIFRLSSHDDRFNRNGLWLCCCKKMADCARAYAAEILDYLAASFSEYVLEGNEMMIEKM